MLLPIRHIALALVLFLASVTSTLGQTCSIPGNAGTETALAAQPNTFFAGTGNPVAGNTQITVAAGTGTNAAIRPGDLLLIIQMQGADINTSNTNSYGSGATAVPGVTNTVAYGASGYAGGINGSNNYAGTYEWSVASTSVTFAAGGTINLMSPLANGYFTQAGSTSQSKRAFQVIRVPQYANVTVSAGFTVHPWNGSAGGVLVLDAAGDINLNGQTIDGRGRGFRGAGAVDNGAVANCTANGGVPTPPNCYDYVTVTTSLYGAAKGEGISGTPRYLYVNDPTGAGTGAITSTTADGYVGGDSSRGAPGNAGGGGNQHNSGGGGGAGGGAGGNGGNTWNSSVSGFFGESRGGFGGSPPSHSATRWFMGGGGGAGDLGGNTLALPRGSGASGGALVVLRASRVVGGGATIDLSGAPALSSTTTDAAGGGGGGGTLVVAAGALSGALTFTANGGNGGTYTVAGLEQDGPGGGGGGGTLITNVAGITTNLNGGLGGGSATTSGCAATSNACGSAAGNGGAGSVVYSGTSPGVQVGYECLPNITVGKSTITPTITTVTGATAGYVVTIRNSGGGARFVQLADWSLPPGWTVSVTSTHAFSPAQPLAAGRLSASAESVAPTSSATWPSPARTTVLGTPTFGSNTLTWTSFALPPIVAGVPSVITVTFTVSIPNTASVSTYHNGMGVRFLDPTRAAGVTTTVTPATDNSTNRTSASYGNTTYANYGGAASTNVAGSNYSGLAGGATTEDVRLLPDFSISKSGSTSVAAGGTFNYTLVPRNNGRAISTVTYATNQTTDVTTANVGTLLGASPVTVTDTLPAGVSIYNAAGGTGWTCSTSSPVVCTLADTSAYPIAASTNFNTVTMTVRVSCNGLSKTNTANISVAANEPVVSQTNNTGTSSTALTGCVSTALTITKTNNLTTVNAGQTMSYTLTVANIGASAANNAVVQDPAATGLSCTSASCAVTGGTAVCPTTSLSALQTPGLVISSFPANSSLTFSIICGVSATGQ